MLTKNPFQILSHFPRVVNPVHFPIQFCCDLASAHLNYCFTSARETEVNRTLPFDKSVGVYNLQVFTLG